MFIEYHPMENFFEFPRPYVRKGYRAIYYNDSEMFQFLDANLSPTDIHEVKTSFMNNRDCFYSSCVVVYSVEAALLLSLDMPPFELDDDVPF